MIFAGFFDLPWWGYVLTALGLTHITIAAVTIFLHRCQAHRALELHPAIAHFFRFWLWLTTGMVTKEWAAIHRKHHAKCETAEDPHSPQIYGINRVLWLGVFLYVKESYNKQTLERYGHGTPDDWMERNVYTSHASAGVMLLLALDLLAFGVVPGVLIWVTQIAWIPFWAAGVINGVGHFFGYRSYDVADASTNIVPWGILIGGEELHNNHHAFASSAKLSSKWYELDIGWLYIRVLEALGLATVKKLAPKPRFAAPKPAADLDTLHAVIANRYDVLSRYAKSIRRTYAQEVDRLTRWSPRDAEVLRSLKRALLRGQALAGAERARLAEALKKSRALATAIAMRDELIALWDRSTASKEQLLRQLQDWCHRAEASGIPPLVDFSQRLRSYS
ncbi:MAG TPA: fatty acid desaturase [Burkholderiales bacterium]|jgi:stearoyl-CoA desaturase (delta-9 desaturase)|nr:fatty acid desaturase [Burkholderiales bacterium]